jgi:hypothetical protein
MLPVLSFLDPVLSETSAICFDELVLSAKLLTGDPNKALSFIYWVADSAYVIYGLGYLGTPFALFHCDIREVTSLWTSVSHLESDNKLMYFRVTVVVSFLHVCAYVICGRKVSSYSKNQKISSLPKLSTIFFEEKNYYTLKWLSLLLKGNPWKFNVRINQQYNQLSQFGT